jgi:hypothetical protein
MESEKMLPKSMFASEAEYIAHLRDWFAGQALAGGVGEGWAPSGKAARCYAVADAMLSHRQQEEQS